MMNRRHFCNLTLSSLAALGAGELLVAPRSAYAADAKPFFFRNGDRVVMIGDSITEQHLHSNYVESYVLSRYPSWDFRFRNVGIGGDTSQGGNSRVARDIQSFNPTAVTITFGMNDGGYVVPYDPARLDRYTKGLQGMFDQMQGKNIRVAVLSSSPVEKKEDGPALQGYNETLERFAVGARSVADKNGALFVDQFHPHLATLQKARDASTGNRINGGDAVHPGPPGQLLMAWAILKGLNAPALVSSVELDAAAGGLVKVENCAVAGLRKTGSGVRFVRADNALPWWIAPEERPILQWAPIVDNLDQYLLKVSGLPAGSYRLTLDEEPAGTASAGDLAKGWNMALVADGPVARQAKAVQDAVFAKNRYYHDMIYRGVVLNGQVPQEQKAALIEERMKGMPPYEQAIRDALAPRPHICELAPAP